MKNKPLPPHISKWLNDRRTNVSGVIASIHGVELAAKKDVDKFHIYKKRDAFPPQIVEALEQEYINLFRDNGFYRIRPLKWSAEKIGFWDNGFLIDSFDERFALHINGKLNSIHNTLEDAMSAAQAEHEADIKEYLI